MTKKYKIWFWVNVGVLVSMFVWTFLGDRNILIESLENIIIRTILFSTNIPVFFAMIMLLIHSRKRDIKYKILTFIFFILFGLISVFISPIPGYCIIAGFAILIPLPIIFNRASYLYVSGIIILAILLYIFVNVIPPEFFATILVAIIIIPLLEIIKTSLSKQAPTYYKNISITTNTGIILFILGLLINTIDFLSYNSNSLFIIGSVIFAICLLYTFISLPKSNYIDWPKDWKVRFLHYEMIPALIFLIIMVISLTMDNFFSLFKSDIYAAYEIDFNRAIQILQ